MKSRIIFAFVFVAVSWLCFAGNAAAQQGYCMNSNFSTYQNVSLGSDGASIIQTVQLSGYISLNNPSVWAGPLTGWIYPCASQNNAMQSTSHTYNITNIVGSTGGSNYSQGAPALNYNTYSVTITAPATPGISYGSEAGGTIICPVAGPIFIWPPGLINFEIAFTRFLTAGYIPDPGPPRQRFYYIGQYCTRDTTPPDWLATGLYFKTADPPTIPTGVADGKAICGRVGNSGSWTCFPYGTWVGSYDAPYVLGNCTHNP